MHCYQKQSGHRHTWQFPRGRRGWTLTGCTESCQGGLFIANYWGEGASSTSFLVTIAVCVYPNCLCHAAVWKVTLKVPKVYYYQHTTYAYAFRPKVLCAWALDSKSKGIWHIVPYNICWHKMIKEYCIEFLLLMRGWAASCPHVIFPWIVLLLQQQGLEWPSQSLRHHKRVRFRVKYRNQICTLLFCYARCVSFCDFCTC